MKRFIAAVQGLALLALAGCWAVSLVSWAGGMTLWGGLLTNFPAHLWLSCSLLILWFAGQKKARALALSLGLWTVYSMQLAPYFLPTNQPDTPARLHILAANILRLNTEYDRIIPHLQASAADLIFLTETGPAQGERLDSALVQYPYRVALPLEGYFGVSLYSRLPLLSVDTLWLISAPVATIRVRLTVGADTLEIWGIHPPSPPVPQETIWRNQFFERLARELGPTGEYPRIVLGDFNLTPTNPRFRLFCRQTHLIDPRRGKGLLPTWPVGWTWIGIALDHALVSEGLSVGLERGPAIGSDHLPMHYYLGWP